ncbi:hypothetical protein HY639_00850 [Candidatus Woesearchaeota archaeon]|nr:hypothetical protein [Candidatus Woesearchaeota archaeon]
MAEKKQIVDNETIIYDGLFDGTDLYRVMDKFFQDKGYDKAELVHDEHVSETGKDVTVAVEGANKANDYTKKVISVKILIKGMKDVTLEKNKHKTRLQQGKVTVIFNAFIVSDVEGKWEAKPMFVFMRALVDRYLYRYYINKIEQEVKDDTLHMKALVKSFLNLHRSG